MNRTRSLIALGTMLALVAGNSAWAAKKEKDSVYSYGRWAVLSPAAGGAEPYVAALTPGANNVIGPDDIPRGSLDSTPGGGGITPPPPGIDDVNPDEPIITRPPNLPPMPVVIEPGIVDVDTSTPVVTAPPSLPPPPAP